MKHVKVTFHVISLLFLLTVVPGIHGLCQDYTYYYNSNTVKFKAADHKIVVKWKDESVLKQKKNTLSGQRSVSRFTEISAIKGLALLEVRPGQAEAMISTLRRDKDLRFAAPVLIDANGNEAGAITDEFIVKLKPGRSFEELSAFASRYGAMIMQQYPYDPITYFLSTATGSKWNAMDLSRLVFESGIAEYAEPNFLVFDIQGTNDPLYSQQYSIRNTGQNGGFSDADMDVEEAWSITRGCAAVRVAVLDSGVELAHPDLDGNLDPGFDATGGGSNGAATGGDAHGTNCAGIVAAEGHNSQGVAGVAYQSRIVPVKVLNDNTGPADDFLFFGWLATGIDWSWQNNRADVISMSLGTFSSSQLVTDAINRAITQGRNNLGCVVLAISHNDGSSFLRFPASLGNVIAVGATNNRDQRASFSNFGTGLDIVAPGVNIATTDRLGATGFSSGDYNTTFTGTSAACPNAAGVVALILSVNPALTQAQARQILESTTDKIGPFVYSTVAGQPNGTWNNEVGYGRVNATSALNAARGGIVSGPDLICSWDSPSFTLPSAPANLGITWQAEPSYLVTSSSGSGATANFSAASSWQSGRVTLTYYSQGVCSIPLRSKTMSIGNPVIDPVGYTYVGADGYYPLQPYYSVPANSVPALYTTASADFNILSDAPYVNIQLLQQSDPAITWGIGTGPQGGMFYFEFMEYNQWVVFRITATNACGTEIFDTGFHGPDQWAMYSMSPNPASDELNISLTPQTNNSATTTGGSPQAIARTLHATLMDQNGNAVRTGTSDGNPDIKLDTRNLADGMYYLHITDGPKVIRKHVIIKH